VQHALELIERYKDCVDFKTVFCEDEGEEEALLIQAVRTYGEELVAALLDAGADVDATSYRHTRPFTGQLVMDTI
jgi:hypothetical protein